MKNFVIHEPSMNLDVAEGVVFSDGTTVVRWLMYNAYSDVRPTTVVHDNLGSVLALHLHDGRREIKWIWKEDK